MTIIDVAEIHSPAPGKKVAYIHTSTGDKYEIWPDKLGRIVIGERYQIETKERDYNGRTIVSITKIEPAPAASPPPGTSPAAPPAGTNPLGEAEYVGHVLAALITAGQIDKEKLSTATHWLRQVWRQTEV